MLFRSSGSVIVGAVVFKFHHSLLQKLACAVVAAPLLCVAAEDAAHQTSPEAKPSGGAFDVHAAERFAKLAIIELCGWIEESCAFR